MPTYEYKCENCGIIEVFQGIMDPSLKNCPNCNSEIKKVIPRKFSVLFKGSGFYCTDSKNSKSCCLGKSEEPDNSTSSCECCCASDVDKAV